MYQQSNYTCAFAETQGGRLLEYTRTLEASTSERKTHLEHSQARDEFKDNYDKFSVSIMLDIREHGVLRFNLP